MILNYFAYLHIWYAINTLSRVTSFFNTLIYNEMENHETSAANRNQMQNWRNICELGQWWQ